MSRKNKQSRGAKRTEKTKKRAARRSSNVIPIRGRDTSEIDMLIREFERWLPSVEFEDDPDKQAAIVDAVRALDFAVGYALPDHRPTEWSLDEVDAAIDFAEYMEEEEDDALPASIAVFALRLFIDLQPAHGVEEVLLASPHYDIGADGCSPPGSGDEEIDEQAQCEDRDACR